METMPFNADRNAIFARLEATAARDFAVSKKEAQVREEGRAIAQYTGLALEEIEKP